MNLRTLATAMKTMKQTIANATDGTFIGVDTVSGGPYTGDLLTTGKVVKINGKVKVIVDGIAYPRHTGDSGRVYASENRLVLLTVNPDTLELTGERTNVGYSSLAKAQYLGTVWEYVVEVEKAIEAKKAAAAAERKRKAAAAKKRIIIDNF